MGHHHPMCIVSSHAFPKILHNSLLLNLSKHRSSSNSLLMLTTAFVTTGILHFSIKLAVHILRYLLVSKSKFVCAGLVECHAH
jgi:hypothetical protein